MSDIALLPFQTVAADQIAARYGQLLADENRPLENKRWAVPYYQALAALTGAGKTPILADAVAQMRGIVSGEPIVLWISKAKAVVEQTLANFQAGGKYAHLLEGFMAMPLGELKPDVLRDYTSPVVALATVGAFNRGKDKDQGNLRVHKGGQDQANQPLWTRLRRRPGEAGERRPLIVVYDEGHNLSDQQTELLLELEPDAILVASATMKTPSRLGRVIQRLKDHGWDADQLATTVSSRDVVTAGLVKQQIILGGYATVMELTLDEMLAAMRGVGKKADEMQAGFTPKAIYVCKTNISQDDGERDNHLRPFEDRKAPPILIWRHLVKKGIDPATIAVYCDLKFDRKNYPPPPGFVHFSGGEEDFAVFRAGRYRHIIFNQSLQEGWDDPECCFAYIDKSMGSSVQVEQVIGRVLRQPGARHYPDPDLNTAHFYIRIDDKQSFPQILELVRRRIAAEMPEVKLDGYADTRERDRMRKEPKEQLTIPEIHINSEDAIGEDDDGPFSRVLKGIIDFGKDTENTVGKGERIRAVQKIGDDTQARIDTKVMAHANRVMARWIMRRQVQTLYPEASDSVDWSLPVFDARVEVTSPAAQQLRESADRLVTAFLEFSELVFETVNPYKVVHVYVNENKLQKFKHAVHEGYSDLNKLEERFALALDEAELMWARNPSNGGFSIPLLQVGDSRRFFPDFLVWKGGVVYALDTKGDHLIGKDAGLKLMNIRDEKSKQKVVVRLITEGKWSDPHKKLSAGGFTVWSIRASKPHPRHFDTELAAVTAAVKP